MSRIERLQSILVLAAAMAGLVLGAVTDLGPQAERMVVPVLMVLLVGVFLQVTQRRLRGATRQVRVLVSSLGVNFVWTPAFAWALGAVVLGAEADLRVGLLMLLVTPCTDWYLVFTGLARGNVALATALLPINLLLQLVLLPVYLVLLAGALVPIDPGFLVEAVLLVLLVPLLTAALIRLLVARGKGRSWLDERVVPRLNRATLVLLVVAVGAVFTAHGDAVLRRPMPVLVILPAVSGFFTVNFLLAQGLSRAIRLPRPEAATLTMTTLARNSPLALAVAVAAFPDRPLIALALVAGPLVELPVLSLAAQILRNRAGDRSKHSQG